MANPTDPTTAPDAAAPRKRILIAVGSFREKSLNRQLAKEAEKLIGDRAEVRYLKFDDLPFMNQDLEHADGSEDPVVARVRREVAEADGLWIVSPEYNRSYPGQVKTLIDWLSRPIVPGDYKTPLPIHGMPVTVSAAGGGWKGQNMAAKLVELLKFVRFQEPTEPMCLMNYGIQALKTNVLTLDDETRQLLSAQVDAFLKAMGA